MKRVKKLTATLALWAAASLPLQAAEPVTLGLNAEEAVELGVLQAAPTACDAYSPTDLLGDTRAYSAGGTVVAIDIRSAAFGSARGVRVGTTLADVKATSERPPPYGL